MIAGKFVTFGPQPRDNALGIDQRLRAAERDERDAGRSIHWKLKLSRFRQGHAARLGTASRKGQAPSAAGLIASAAKVQGLDDDAQNSATAAASGDRSSPGAASINRHRRRGPRCRVPVGELARKRPARRRADIAGTVAVGARPYAWRQADAARR